MNNEHGIMNNEQYVPGFSQPHICTVHCSVFIFHFPKIASASVQLALAIFEFKLEVVKDYYRNQLGVRTTAMKFGLPSKNYVTNWEQYLKKKGLLPQDATKPIKAGGRAPENVVRADDRTAREKQYEAEIEALKARVAYYEGLDSLQPFLKKEGIRQVKYEMVLSLANSYPVSLLCVIAGISRAAFYKYKRRELKPSADIDDKIIDLYKKSGRRYGYRMIKMRLKSVYGLTVNHKKIRRIMKTHELKSIVRPKYRKPPQDDIIIKPNILNRDFIATKPYEKLVTDITYIPTPHKMMYLSTVIDLFDNYPIAWYLSDNQDKSLSIDTIKKLPDIKDAILHSDRGVHYTNKDFKSLLDRLGLKQSMSRKGNCWDNACAESFFSQYKSECIYLNKGKLKKPSDVIEVTAEYFDYYINQRPQKKLGGLTPSEFRLAYQK